MFTQMTPEEKTRIENEIKNNFSELQKKLEDLKSEIKSETDETKKQQKQSELQKMETELAEIKKLIDTLSSLHEQDLQSLKTRLEDLKKTIQEFRGETADLLREKVQTPTTYELLKDSETSNKILQIIRSNPNKFKDIPGNSENEKLEYIFSKIRSGVVLFLKNKLGNSEKYDKIINNTIAPALEWSMMEMLRDQGNEMNTNMLKGLDKISWDNFNKLVSGVSNFAKNTSGSFNKFNAWVNAIDYLSIHNGVLNKPEKSAVLTSPIEFKNYLNDSVFASSSFSPYAAVDKNIFKIDENQTFEFGISLQEKQSILNEIGNIQVVNNPKTTALIAKMINKPEKFFGAAAGLQNTANHLLNGLNAINGVTKIFGTDIMGEITKAPEERSFMYRIIDFICKLIGITGGLEGVVKRWRLDRLNLTDEKNENISLIFKEYQKLVGKGTDISITDENGCRTILNDFTLTELDKSSSTKGDHLRDVMAENIDLSLISLSVVQQTLGDTYLKRETIVVDGKQQEKVSVDVSKISESKKRELAHKHIDNMRNHLIENYQDLKDFYANVHNTDDIILCMTASLYASKDDVIEGIKAKVFLPENYGVTYEGSSNGNGGNEGDGNGRENLDSNESADKQTVSEQWMYDKAVEYGITDRRQIAYILATVKGECAFKNQKEIGGENKNYGKVDSSTGKAYYGRGFIQLTHKYNYEKYTSIIKSSGKDFKDNDGNIIKGSEVDLVNNPDIILKSNDLAAFILMDWMKNGGPNREQSRRLDYYINESKTDFYHARAIINGMSSNSQEYANNAQAYVDRMNNDGSMMA